MAEASVGIAGKRGAAFLPGLRSVPGAAPTAFFDPDPAAQEALAALGLKPVDSYEALLGEVDAVIVASPPQHHADQAIAALAAGRHVLSEAPAALTIEDCWRIFSAALGSESTYMLAENTCFWPENILIKELVHRGDFGDLTFGEGDVVRCFRPWLFADNGQPTWRWHWQTGRAGNTAITHGLGPVMQWFWGADQFNRVESVACMSSRPRLDPPTQHGDTSIALCRLTCGSLIKVRQDLLSNRPEMASFSLQGTLGAYESGRAPGEPARIWFGGEDHPENREWRRLDDLWDALEPDLRAEVDEARRTPGIPGDWLTGRRFAQCVVEGMAPELDAHAALHWTAAGLCSQTSAANGGAPIFVPNFSDPAQRPTWLEMP